ncbi:MAG: succinylglutamate desuccinylase/aspartoacylase family protein [Armatimonadota bacterium]|nr:succinylglutamate desuccinylase/aspartoacylase family protein [Armatimonadota bacterium]
MGMSGKTTTVLTARGPAGETIEVPVGRVTGTRDGPTMLLVAGVHGSEYVGIEACKRIFLWANPDRLSGTLITVPCLNVPAFYGLAAHVNPIDGINPGRVFPGRPDGSYTERMVHLVWELARRADYVIDLHGGDLEEELVHYSQINLTGNAAVDDAAEGLARALNMPFFVRRPAPAELPMANSGLHPIAASHGIPAVLAEAGSHGVLDENEVSVLVGALRNALRHVGLIAEPLDPPREPLVLCRFEGVAAPAEGFWYPTVGKGEVIRRGQRVGEMRGFFDEPLATVTSGEDAAVLGVIATPARRKGDLLLGLGTLD